eukprot:scaffold2917_cov191-Amphora_coffeaeformis.AAC.16
MTSRVGLPTSPTSSGELQETAVPTLRVMRLQNPELFMPTAGTLDSQPMLNNSLCLPDSLDVYVGENFTAYLGVINSNRHTSIRRLTVTAQLQTPTQRWHLKSPLDAGNGGYGMDVPPLAGVDAVVSHAIEEPGQHILRAEVSSLGPDGNNKTFRKFYRFQVTYPVEIRTRAVRAGDAACFVTLSVEYTNNAEYASAKDVMVLANVELSTTPGLTATLIGAPTTTATNADANQTGDKSSNALQLYDTAHVMQRGTMIRYLFKVEATAESAKLRGLAANDLLGKALVTWRKSIGEQGTVKSDPIYCPLARIDGPIFQSGLTVDVAANKLPAVKNLSVTVEPIDPPRRMALQVPTKLQFLVVNHAEDAKTLQLQFRSSGLAVYGASSLSLGTVPGAGGSKVAVVNFVALTAGLLRLEGCWVIDQATDTAIAQPPLLDVFVEHETQ